MEELMKTISEYKIIVSSSEEIGKQVLKSLNDGFELYGSPFGIAYNPGWGVGQALIKTKEVKKTSTEKAKLISKGLIL
jgi:hypothetical protein